MSQRRRFEGAIFKVFPVIYVRAFSFRRAAYIYIYIRKKGYLQSLSFNIIKEEQV